MDTNFPIKVVCPECQAAVSAKCTEMQKPLDPSGYKAAYSGERFVDWFHFARIEKANEEGIYGKETA